MLHECNTESLTWTSQSTTIPNGMVAYSPENGRYVSTANKQIYYSSDAVSWTDSGVSLSSPKMIGAGNGVFVVAGYSELKVSQDGITWTNIATCKCMRERERDGRVRGKERPSGGSR